MPDKIDEWLALFERQQTEREKAEDRAAKLASAELRSQLADLLREALKRWTLIAGPLDTELTPDMAQRISAMLGKLLDRLAQWCRKGVDFLSAALAGFRLGIDHGVEQFDKKLSVPPFPERKDLSAELRSRLHDAPSVAIRQVDRARSVLRAEALDRDRFTTTLATARRTAQVVETEARETFRAGSTEGTQRVATAAESSVIWISERDGCLDCLAYAGQIDRGDGFAPGRTFAAKPRIKRRGRFNGPPLHPHCRCFLAVGPTSVTALNALTSSLAREARRSVIKGWALPSESDAARRAAADRLLKRGARLPKTVESRAKTAVRSRKRFTRPVP